MGHKLRQRIASTRYLDVPFAASSGVPCLTQGIYYDVGRTLASRNRVSAAQEFDHVGAAAAHRQIERTLAAPVASLALGSRFEQELHTRCIPCDGRRHQRRCALASLRFCVRARPEQ